MLVLQTGKCHVIHVFLDEWDMLDPINTAICLTTTFLTRKLTRLTEIFERKNSPRLTVTHVTI